MNHICSKEAEISQIKTKVEGIDKVINGNGQPGLRDLVVTLNERVNALIESMDSQKKTSQWHVSTVISIVVAIVAVIAMILKI